ncbi:MAG: hypothetical protein C0617_04570 [Desulfuromonas sp.]|uniref:hypothetical protein n=1 Tax=Desulfuromonas sp. TaxID=892 RepID=UPI000CA6C335|nr:hypothetical protein [Desulfuromonas sp.]PLX85351.1 MAG: hypothetical protein C0617_04570 [Desulfuromonas sp.]
MFERLRLATEQALEAETISQTLAERLFRIGERAYHYKHLGLEINELIRRLNGGGAGGKGADGGELEAAVAHIEQKCRKK